MRTKWTVIVLSLVEVELILLLGTGLISQKSRPSVISITPISSQSVVYLPNDNFKYYYDISLSSGTYSNNQGKVLVNINKDHLNSLKDFSLNKDPDAFRIMTIGDSFTYGAGVSTKDNYPTQLEEALNTSQFCLGRKFEIINLGVSGYDMAYAAHRFDLIGEKYHPDLIIWLVTTPARINEFRLPILASLIAQKNLTSEQRQALSNGTADQRLMNDVWNKVNEMEMSYSAHETQTYLDGVIQRFKGSFVGPVLMAEFPLDPYLSVGKDWPMLERVVAPIPSVKTYRLPANIYDPQYRLSDRHLNADGNRNLAESLASVLKSRGLIPCP